MRLKRSSPINFSSNTSILYKSDTGIDKPRHDFVLLRIQFFVSQFKAVSTRQNFPRGAEFLFSNQFRPRNHKTKKNSTSYPGSFLYAPGWRKYPGWGWSRDPYKIDSLSGGWESLWSDITCFHFRTSHFDCKEWPPEESSF